MPHTASAPTQQPDQTPISLARARDAVLLRAAQRVLKGLDGSSVKVTGPSGRSAIIGRGPQTASLELKSLRPLWQAATRGGLGFAESYMDGDVKVDDLGRVMRVFCDNYEQIAASGRGLFKVRGADKVWHRARSNTREGSKANIHAHYDLGNEFYKLWLDPGMTYSSALYPSEGASLDTAQDAKYARILEALQLGPGTSLLEIGCGWGGMAERGAIAGADVSAVTVSAEQLAYAQDRIEKSGLRTKAEVSFTDYRDVTGQYDRIVSIEMIEAVGEEHWLGYFATLANRLKPGGSAVVQAITIREEDFPLYRSRPDFIQRYIFPGGMLPTVSVMQQMAGQVGLSFETIERFGPSYAQTLRDWRAQFQTAWPKISALGFDERFRRMWDYYLTYCEVGFERGYTDVGIYRMTKPAD
jgi:cyclopropane-fatty-acyl-phospholipid synthase